MLGGPDAARSGGSGYLERLLTQTSITQQSELCSPHQPTNPKGEFTMRFVMQFVAALFSLSFNFLVTHTWSTKVTVPGLTALPADAPLAVTGDYAVEVEQAVAAGVTNVEIDVGTIVASKIQSIIINADLAAMDVYTNDAAGSTGQHFALAANKSVAWNNQLPNQTNPTTVNISKFYANNSSV